jgi:outer membrane lipoprotein SlyB
MQKWYHVAHINALDMLTGAANTRPYRYPLTIVRMEPNSIRGVAAFADELRLNVFGLQYGNGIGFGDRREEMLLKARLYLVVVLSSAVLAGCAQPTLTGTTFSRDEVRQAQTVQMGYVESSTFVVIEGRTGGIVGAGTGAALGGIAASGIGGGRGRDMATVAGAVAGGIAGQRVEESVSRRQGVEITVRLDNGSLISVVQEVDQNQIFEPGDRVRVLGQGRTVRVTR